MQKSLFLNELSFSRNENNNRHACKESLSHLIKLTAALNKGQATAINHMPEIWVYDLVEGYSLSSWIGDTEVSGTEKSYLRDSLNRGRKLSPDKISELSCKVGDQSATGFLYTHVENGIALSILSDKKWDSSKISADFEELDTVSGEVESFSRDLPHIAQDTHVQFLKDIIFPPACNSITNAGDLIRYLEAVKDYIVVCDSALKQISTLTDIKTIKGLVEKLEGLNAYVGDLGPTGQLDMEYIRCNLFYMRPDTPNTLAQYGEERTFRLPDGSSVTFNWHFDLPPASSRRGYIHWCPKTRKVYVGYVGKHLNTKKY